MYLELGHLRDKNKELTRKVTQLKAENDALKQQAAVDLVAHLKTLAASPTSDDKTEQVADGETPTPSNPAGNMDMLQKLAQENVELRARIVSRE